MNYKEERKKIISNIDGLELDVLELVPEEQPKGIIQIHHGMSEYKERYLPFMEYMTEKGYLTVIHDCRGHGESVRDPKDLGYMYGGGARALVEDIHQITMELKKQWPGVPTILLGHSMGSLVVRAYTKKYDKDLDMLIVCGSPSRNLALKMGRQIARIQKKWKGDHHPSKLLDAASFGSFAKKFPQESSRFSWCCSDQKVVEQYDNSPLCGFTFSVDGFEALFQLMEECYSLEGWECNYPDLPILFIGGSEDPCIGGPRKYARTIQHMRRVGYKKTKGKLYPGMRHEILNEKEKHRVFRDVRKWMEKQMEEM